MRHVCVLLLIHQIQVICIFICRPSFFIEISLGASRQSNQAVGFISDDCSLKFEIDFGKVI